MLDRLPEPDARIEHHAALAHALVDREREALFEECAHGVDDVVVARFALHRARLAEHVHEAQLAPRVGDDRRHLRVGAQRCDVVDDARPRGDRRARDERLGRVDRDLCGRARGELGDDGLDARELLVEQHGLSAGAGGLATDVEDVGTLAGEPQRMLDGGDGVDVEAPVGERVGGHVHDPHHAETRAHGRQLSGRHARRRGLDGCAIRSSSAAGARARAARRCRRRGPAAGTAAGLRVRACPRARAARAARA